MGFDHISKKFDKRANWVTKDPDVVADDGTDAKAETPAAKAEVSIGEFRGWALLDDDAPAAKTDPNKPPFTQAEIYQQITGYYAELKRAETYRRMVGCNIALWPTPKINTDYVPQHVMPDAAVVADQLDKGLVQTLESIYNVERTPLAALQQLVMPSKQSASASRDWAQVQDYYDNLKMEWRVTPHSQQTTQQQQTEEQIIRQLYAENRHKWPAGRDEMVCVHWVGRPLPTASAGSVAGEVTHYVFTKRGTNYGSLGYIGFEIVCNGFMLDAKMFTIADAVCTQKLEAWPAQP